MRKNKAARPDAPPGGEVLLHQGLCSADIGTCGRAGPIVCPEASRPPRGFGAESGFPIQDATGMTTIRPGARAPTNPSSPWTSSAAPGPRDVQIDIAYCGICHSDPHTVRSEWPGTRYPCVPGHGSSAASAGRRRVRTSRSAMSSASAARSAALTRGLRRRPGAVLRERLRRHPQRRDRRCPGHTLGGYSQRIVVDRDFVLKVRHPESQLAAVAPLLCARASPPIRRCATGARAGQEGRHRRHRRARPHGHQIAYAMGAHVVAFTTSESKRGEARKLGADEVVISKDAARISAQAGSFDHRHRRRLARPGCVHRAAQARRHPVPGRRAGARIPART